MFNDMFVQQGSSPVRDPTVLNPLTGKFLEGLRGGELLSQLVLCELDVSLVQDGCWTVPDGDDLVRTGGTAVDVETGGACLDGIQFPLL